MTFKKKVGTKKNMTLNVLKKQRRVIKGRIEGRTCLPIAGRWESHTMDAVMRCKLMPKLTTPTPRYHNPNELMNSPMRVSCDHMNAPHVTSCFTGLMSMCFTGSEYI